MTPTKGAHLHARFGSTYTKGARLEAVLEYYLLLQVLQEGHWLVKRTVRVVILKGEECEWG